MKLQKQILITTLIAGTLDITGAFISGYLVRGVSPDIILKSIASGVFGKAAFDGGFGMMAMGLLFHFIIAFACTFIFFILYPKINFLKKNIFLNAVLIALSAWMVTNLIIMPLSKFGMPAFTTASVARAISILILCIGLPISYSAKKYYQS